MKGKCQCTTRLGHAVNKSTSLRSNQLTKMVTPVNCLTEIQKEVRNVCVPVG